MYTPNRIWFFCEEGLQILREQSKTTFCTFCCYAIEIFLHVGVDFTSTDYRKKITDFSHVLRNLYGTLHSSKTVRSETTRISIRANTVSPHFASK